MSAPTDIELPQLPDAASAELHRIGNDWALSFAGPQPGRSENITIRADSLVEAGVNPSLDRLVTGYVETRLLAAGYGIAPSQDGPPNCQCAWVLHR
jgi:hypothetical protein